MIDCRKTHPVMKQLQLLVVFLLCLVSTASLAQNDPVNYWISWNCEGFEALQPVNVGHRRFLVRFQTPWTEGVREVSYSKSTMWGTQWEYYGPLGPGEHVIELTIDDPWPSVYYEQPWTALKFTDPSGVEPEIVSTSIQATTEPAPTLSVTQLPSEGDSVKFSVDSEALIGGFGGVTVCEKFAIQIVVDVASGEGSPLYTTTLWCTPGAATNETLGFVTNTPTKVCVTAKMNRVDTSTTPAFVPHLITENETTCFLVGDVTTTVSDLDEERLVIYPNPCLSWVTIATNEHWSITTLAGKVLRQGNGPEKVNTEAWSPGVYLVRFQKTVQRLLRE